MQGRVLSIERMAVHDGPGIRTTVYLKGCSLRCRWCHNPESISPEPQIGLQSRRCIGCGSCVAVCPNGAHTLQGGEHLLDHRVCTACGACVEACLPGALVLYGRQTSAEEVAATVLQDKTFYDTSGGGCTVSGGEPLLQAEFCAEVLALLKQENVHCAVDTSGAVAWERFETVLPLADMFLYDVKHVDEALHQEHTGGSSRRILDNLRRLSQCGVPIEVRIPTIPGFNADEVSMASIGETLAGLDNLVGVRLLPYHLARQKYEAVGRPDTMPEVAPPDEATMARLTEILRGYGLVVLA